jgi:outer membrane lipoprotein SlyB
VVSIEVIPRQGAAGSSGAAGMTGAAGSSTGATGSMSDNIYRVTLRMDDGSTRVVTQETTPGYRSGDRVNLTGGVIQH